MINVSSILMLIVAIALTVVVAIQPSKGEGLGSIGGGGQMFFAKNKGYEQLLEKVTTWLAGAFFMMALVIGIMEKFA